LKSELGIDLSLRKRTGRRSILMNSIARPRFAQPKSRQFVWRKTKMGIPHLLWAPEPV